ncbi:D-alanyl-D-alanine carboxypeptidase/D-alanyl-D-alanine-endopeptidase (penicillin-binding protein 4) [Actinomadura pelletieri DSM 43383]|uniref:D-alanyl-D-alanine carboxypeptidase/D-alanyl-D-alanine-endopeptidase (Penicillin-binding protein 4) n=1 Tax=Actinomadura pelletieri DSM 43383 TaxID=1120940 RepID=A0A495QKW5_9ACTN|nr:D-alanyl-D-alanine carboxypeptidase/D-alanyl-D-alanine-endopeptidase [Actinomadura pelletieri]RKS73212.1 D-alanyl-D-alanine carboxypeptidase/D-alanyl-D-alanine-endopeptidase (penicillin-binding protein 4) [Actinomadura pelletieri DSM 43383]
MVIRRVGAVLLLGAGLVAGGAVPALADLDGSGPDSGRLARDLDAVLRDERLAGASVGVVVRDAASGRILYDRGGDTPLMPASNNKLYTSAAAFGILGAGYRFRTTVSVKGGNLYLTGTGDTTMRAADYDRLAAAVAAKGISAVEGDLVADDTWFGGGLVRRDWDPEDLQYAYAGRISALTVSPNADHDAGSVALSVTAAGTGEPVEVTLTPATGAVKVDNRATTGPAGSRSTVAVNRGNGSDIIVVTGSHPVGAPAKEFLRTVEDPALYAADVFRRALRAHGVRVAGTTERGRTPVDATTVAARTSMPLSRLAAPFMKLSNNVIAETLVKAIGRKVHGRGTWAAGLPAVAAHLRRLGVDPARVTMTDGSGLARSNRTTAAQLATLLRNARRQTWFPAWYASLPIAGRSGRLMGGTLANRMVGTAAAGNVHAKTGTLTGVTALSGYVTRRDGRTLVFSSVFNGYTGRAPKDVEDAIAVRLATDTP